MPKRYLVIAVVLLLVAGAAGLVLTTGPEPTPVAEIAAPIAPVTARTLADSAVAAIYVAPDGRPDADGSKAHPIDLATALAANTPANPGDTIWLKGGTYSGNFRSELRGAESAPIIVRQVPGERAVISAASSNAPALTVTGLSTWYCDFEIMNPHPERTTAEVQNVAIRQGAGISVGAAAHIKFINLIIHDLQGGLLIPAEPQDIEVYGNVIYYNGWQRADGVGEGHGIWVTSQVEGRFMRENIIFDQFSHGIQAYGNRIDNMFIDGNVVFNNGSIAKFLDRNIMVAAGAKNLVLSNNMTYYPGGPAALGEGVNIGLGGDCPQARLTNNYLTGSNPLNLTDCKPLEMKGNTLHGRFDAAYAKRYPDNAYMMPKDPPMPTMSGVKVFVRPNQYDPGRAHIVVFNWDRLPTVDVDLRGVKLKPGDEYELRNAQDYFAAPVATGTYSDTSLVIPMRNLGVAKPIGTVTLSPPQTAPEFGVFVLLRKVHSATSTTTTP